MDYSHMTVTELRKIAKEKGVPKATSLKKQELLDVLQALEAEAEKKENAAAEDTAEVSVVEDTPVLERRPTDSVRNEASEDGSESDSNGTEENENGEESENTAAEGEGQEKPADGQQQGEQPQRKDGPGFFNRGDTKEGILEIMPDGFGFIRSENFLPGDADVYVSPQQIRKFNLRTGDIIVGITKQKTPTEKFNAMLYCKTVNGNHPYDSVRRPKFENLTPIFPHERLRLETPGCSPAMRIMDILSPIGKGQRGMIVSQPKAGKTTLLKQIAKAICTNNPEMHMIILLIDERPEEVTDIRESIEGKNVEVIYSTFDELPEHHKRVSEMVIERAKRLVEQNHPVPMTPTLKSFFSIVCNS